MKFTRLVFPLACLFAATTLAADRPNIIFILVDDLGFGDVGVFFQNARRSKGDHAEPWHLTPQLDAMAADGLQLRQHYCSAPVCAPSRASLLLGVHQGHANVRNNQFDKALEENHTLATVLHGAGYATAAIGKWGLQGGPGEKDPANAKAGPNDWPAYPTKRGFDFFHGYVRHRDGHAHYPHEDQKQVWENEHEISQDLAGCYTTDLFTARAKKWIADQHRAQPQQPFFLYLAYDTPHAKLQLPPCDYPAGGGVKGGVQWLDTPGKMITTATGAPDSFTHPDYAAATWDDDSNASTPEKPWPDVYKRYATDVRRIDDCIGDLLQLLKDLAIDEQTLVVFTSDNGPSRESYLPQNYEPTFFRSFGAFDGIKRDLWEGGIRTGAIVRWPKHAAPQLVSELPCQAHDWMATFAELAGVAAPARADGTSLVAEITARGTQKTPQVYVEYSQPEKTPNYPAFAEAHRNRPRNQMQAIRVGEFIGVRYDVRSHSEAFEIYDIASDPQETKNLAASRPELQQKMHDAVLRMRRPDESSPRPYDSDLIPALPAAKVSPGIEWRGFARAAPWLGRLDDLSPRSTGTAAQISAQANDCDALLFTGCIEIPADGEYTFTAPANALALLRIHDATVIDSAFAPSAEPKSGKIALHAGRHPFRYYWQNSTAAPLLEITGPGMTRQPLPAAMLFHE